MPRSNWPKAVDAWPTTQPMEGAVSALSESGGVDASRTESPLGVKESPGEEGGDR